MMYRRDQLDPDLLREFDSINSKIQKFATEYEFDLDYTIRNPDKLNYEDFLEVRSLLVKRLKVLKDLQKNINKIRLIQGGKA
jgi:hypothetical protein